MGSDLTTLWVEGYLGDIQWNTKGLEKVTVDLILYDKKNNFLILHILLLESFSVELS